MACHLFHIKPSCEPIIQPESSCRSCPELACSYYKWAQVSATCNNMIITFHHHFYCVPDTNIIWNLYNRKGVYIKIPNCFSFSWHNQMCVRQKIERHWSFGILLYDWCLFSLHRRLFIRVSPKIECFKALHKLGIQATLSQVCHGLCVYSMCQHLISPIITKWIQNILFSSSPIWSKYSTVLLYTTVNFLQDIRNRWRKVWDVFYKFNDVSVSYLSHCNIVFGYIGPCYNGTWLYM